MRSGNRVYKVDKKHPLIKAFLSRIGAAKPDFNVLIKLLEESVPVERIWLDMAEHPEKSNEPFGGTTEKSIIEAATAAVTAINGTGKNVDPSVVEIVLNMDVFSAHRELLLAHFSVAGGE